MTLKNDSVAEVLYGDKKNDLTAHYGQMNDPTCCSYLKGPCGDFMEFYLAVDTDGRITEIMYYTEGCDATRTCASIVCLMARGATVMEALSISAGAVLAKIKNLPDDHRHCAILSVSSLYRAIADYLLMP